MEEIFKIAIKEYGVKEIVGHRHNPRILDYFKKVHHSWVKTDELAWCASFVGFCIESAGYESTRALNARSYLKWGEFTLDPQVGDLVVFWRDSENSWKGHVGFYINETEDGYINVLGGNQNNQVCIQEYPKYKLLGYRRVKSDTVSVVKDTRTLAQKVNDLIISHFKNK